MRLWNERMGQDGQGGRRPSMRSTNTHSSHTSRRHSSLIKDIESSFLQRKESEYPPWWTRDEVIDWYRNLPDDTLWNSYICVCVLVGLVWTVAQLEGTYINILDAIYNISYAIHIAAIGFKYFTEQEHVELKFQTVLRFFVDLCSFSHSLTGGQGMKLVCYYVRLHRPYQYLWSLNNFNLKGSILGTTLKYCYIFMVLRITWAYIWLHLYVGGMYEPNKKTVLDPSPRKNLKDFDSPAAKFLSAAYLINKMFIPIGPSEYPDTDTERIVCLLIVLTGCLVVTGAAVASLSLVISLYMRPEETFRSRYRLIMKEMKDTQVPASLRDKVETFYKMYWHKQSAVSQTQLLPTFPPTLPATVNTDIYFEATQKARILRELSHQILSELARKMETIHYIPGDAIIKRGSKKCQIIYITYGDVEMLTAEDDITAILRMTRGTVLTPYGCAAAAAVGTSHLAVRAATFCTAHILTAAELWRVVTKHSITQDHAWPILCSFADHIDKVKRHYQLKMPDDAIHKSSILNFNRNLMMLKEMKDADGQPLLASSEVFLEIAGCYIMRNRPDCTLTDQSDEICLRPIFPCILQPSSSLLVAWHAFVALLILVVCITHPYYLVYKKTVSLEFRFFDYVMTAVFVLDHIVHLSTGTNVEEGVPITFSQTSSQQMRSRWFVLDVMATLPIFEFVGTGHFAGLNKILRLPKLFRVLKSFEESCVYHSNVLRFLSYTLLLLIACYLIAAMQQGFMCYQSGYCLVTNFTHHPFWQQKPLDEETVTARLIFGLYWALSMINFITHRETWGKENWNNIIYTMAILEVCIVLRIFIEAVYSATIMVTTALRENYGSRIATVKSFLIRNDVDPLLRWRFITYLQLCWYTDKAYKMTHKRHSNIFYDLPAHVYQDIVGRNRSKYILVIPFMKLLKKEDLRAVSSFAKLFYTSPNEILLNTGELTNEIYIIKQGICEVLDPVTQKRIGTLTTKNYFGGLICLLRIPAYYTVRAITHVQVLCVHRKHLQAAFANPHIQQAVEYCKTVPEYIVAQKKMDPFVKYEPPPPSPNMMHFRLPRKHEPDSEFMRPFKRLGFLSILRYVVPRYTIRPDGKYLLCYEWVRVICALCSAQLFPHYTYLVLQWPFLYYITLLLDMSAYFDVLQRMLIGYFNADGILVYHPASTAAYYLKGAFLVDLFSCLPLENLEAARKESFENKLRVTPTKQFLMLNRLIQLYRMPSAMQMLKEYIERRDILMVLQAIPLFMAMLNVLTCFMVFYSVKIFYWVFEDGHFEWSIEPFEDHGGSWLHLFKDVFRFNLTSTPWNLHLATYFWVVYECSTTGYGVFNPSNKELMEVLFVGITSSVMIITYFSVRIISIRANVNNSLAGFKQHMMDINVYMTREKLNEDLRKELRRFYEFNWEKMGGIDYRGVLKLCDQITLRTDAIVHIYGPTFTQCPILPNGDVSLLRILGRAVHSVYFIRDMKILEQDDMVTDMYFVDYGGVEVRVTVGENVHFIRLPKGSVFGNIEGTVSHRISYNVVATSRLHLLMINSAKFYSITSDFPAVKVLMDKSKTGMGTDKKMYILGGEAVVNIRRPTAPAGPPPRRKTNILKYIYFQDGLVQYYLISVCMACIYLDMFNAGYQVNTIWMLSALYSLDFCFLLKIISQNSLPFLVPNKNIKKMMLPIRAMYFKGDFRYDFISILPVELLSFAVQEKNLSWMVFSLLRLNRIFRVVTVYKCLRRRHDNITMNLTMTTIISVLIWFTLFVHAISCIWFFIGMVEDSIEPNSSWIYMDSGETHCDSNYVCSIYFVITTFTQNGVGDIMPKKQSEVVFVALLQIVSTMMFMIYVGEFSNIIQFQSHRSFSFYSKYLELQEFLKNNRVSQNLVTIVNKYTLHLWRENRGLQMPHFLEHAPLSLRLRVMSAAYLHHFTKHEIFEECEPAFLRQLVGCLKLYTYNAGMYVVKESEITDSMYIIHTGKVKEIFERMDLNSAKPRLYRASSYFGMIQGLKRNTPYVYSYQTVTKSQVLTLKLDDWEYLLKHFPKSWNTIHRHMRYLGDDNVDKGNWPGGARTDSSVSAYAKISDITDLPTTSQILRIESKQLSTAPSETIDRSIPLSPDKSLTQQSVEPVEVETADRATQAEDQTESREEQDKKKFYKKIISTTAKRLMGRVSDHELAAVSGQTTDELLLEEDEEATEALLAQFEAAKKMTERGTSTKRTWGARKTSLYPDDDNIAEKQLVALEVTESMTELIKKTESPPFVRQPLRIRESETEITPLDTPRDVLNLGRIRSKTKPDSLQTQDINLESRKSADTLETTKETELIKGSSESTDVAPDKTVEVDQKPDPKIPTISQTYPEMTDLPKIGSTTGTIADTIQDTTNSKLNEDISHRKNDDVETADIVSDKNITETQTDEIPKDIEVVKMPLDSEAYQETQKSQAGDIDEDHAPTEHIEPVEETITTKTLNTLYPIQETTETTTDTESAQANQVTDYALNANTQTTKTESLLNPNKPPSSSASSAKLSFTEELEQDQPAPEIKLIQYLAETEDLLTDATKDADGNVIDTTQATDEPIEESTAGAKEINKEMEPDEETKEGVSSSKAGRRHVHVRYEEDEKVLDVIEPQEVIQPENTPDTHLNIFTMDSDQPQPDPEKAEETNEGDDQATNSTADPKNNPYYRKRSD